ncbi:MAG: hypothetical protein C5B58_14580 [Acidobacteria bacterium]|nr:MAG: hypothetical protein C5B58_14580 [Acidobacteriota bacterium]
MKDLPESKPKIEPRWPVVSAILAVLFLLVSLPSRLRVLPAWVPYLLAVSVIVPMLGVTVSRGKLHWMRFERVSIWIFDSIAGLAVLEQLRRLLGAILRPSTDVTGLQLLASSIEVWASNVLVFSIIYWRIDRSGPEARASRSNAQPDWQFPQESSPDGNLDGWCPTFVDYLFLGYCTATSFTLADAQPLTARAKLLMMFQSMISLVTVVAIVSRAINILGK